jgi:hypothetical protein
MMIFDDRGENFWMIKAADVEEVHEDVDLQSVHKESNSMTV